MNRRALALVVAALAIPTGAFAQATSQEVKVPGGMIKVSITPLPATGTPKGPKMSPRIGVSASSPLSTPLARKLDDAGKVQVVSPAKFSAGAAAGSFDTVTRSEFVEALVAGCRQSKVDYALYEGQPELTTGVSTTALIFGFGRSNQTNTFEMRLYDCRTREPVWDATVAVEASAGIWTNMFSGKVSGGGGQSQDAAAEIIATKLIADMGLGGVSVAAAATTPDTVPPAPASSVASADSSSAVTMSKPGHLYSIASAKGKVLKTLAAGAILYPTGSKQGIWQQVTDEEGTKGWVSSQLVAPYP